MRTELLLQVLAKVNSKATDAIKRELLSRPTELVPKLLATAAKASALSPNEQALCLQVKSDLLLQLLAKLDRAESFSEAEIWLLKQGKEELELSKYLCFINEHYDSATAATLAKHVANNLSLALF